MHSSHTGVQLHTQNCQTQQEPVFDNALCLGCMACCSMNVCKAWTYENFDTSIPALASHTQSCRSVAVRTACPSGPNACGPVANPSVCWTPSHYRPSCGSTFIVLDPPAGSGTCTWARGSRYAARGRRTACRCAGEFSGGLPALRACGVRQQHAAFGKALVRGPHPLGLFGRHQHFPPSPQGLGGRPFADTGLNITRYMT